MKTAISKKVVVAAVLGNALEFYDFAAYAFFAVYIGQAFFPASTEVASLLLSLGAFGVGYIFRPLGGVLIGAFADRAGRRPAMLLTIVLITAGTMGLALTPSYKSIGLAAPVIVVLCRLVQGFAIGGEVGPASAFLIEIAPANRRGLYGSWQLASQGLAALAAGAIGLALSLVLEKADLAAWGWRVPFLLCLLPWPDRARSRDRSRYFRRSQSRPCRSVTSPFSFFMAPNDSATPGLSCNRTTPGYHVVVRPGAMPHVLVNEPPGSSLIRASPVRKAFGGQVMGSTARLRRRRTSGSVSPVKSIR